jgi:hypothetical protein
MKYLLLSLSLLIGIPVTFAQNPQKGVVWAKEYKNKNILENVLGEDGTHIFTLKSKPRRIFSSGDYYIERIDLTGRFIEEKLIALPDNRNFETAYMLKHEIYIFSSEKRDKMQYLYVDHLNKKTLEPEGKSQLITSFDYSEGGWWNKGNFSVEISSDESKVLAYYKLPYSRTEYERFGLFVYDTDLELIWKREVELPYIDKLFDTKMFIVDNLGSVHLLARLYKDKVRTSKKGEPNYAYHLLSYSERSMDPVEVVIGLKDIFLQEMFVATVDGETLYCAGYFSEDKKWSIKGVFALEIDPKTGDIDKYEINTFSIDFITSLLSERQAKKKKKKEAKGKAVELTDIKMKHIVIHEDGGLTVVGEREYTYEVTVVTQTGSGGTTTQTKTYFVNNEIVVAYLNSNLKMDWVKNVIKYQVSQNPFYQSYFMQVHNDKLVFFFNDNIKNDRKLPLKPKDIKSFISKPNKSNMMKAEVDGAGAIRWTEVYFKKGDKHMLRTEPIFQIFDDKVLLYSTYKKKKRYGIHQL